MKNKQWVEVVLRSLDFVQWDRYYPIRDSTAFYGWINRDKDQYKDFVLVILDTSNKRIIESHTSSAKYSEEIVKILFGNNRGHNECQRVEDKLAIDNKIELQKEEEVDA